MSARLGSLFRYARAAVALASGLASVLLFRRGLAFAPVAAASIVLAWMLGAALAGPAQEGAGRRARVLRFLGRWLVASLHQDALFFLLPVWFGSATWPSHNIGFPVLLATLAVLSCVDGVHGRYFVEWPVGRAVVNALCLFGALLPAAAVLLKTPLLYTVAGAAGASSALAMLSLLPRHARTSRRGLARAALATVACAIGLTLGAPLLPPVPVQCLALVTAGAVVEREPSGAAERFPAGTPRVFAHVSIVAPPGFASTLRFDWTREGSAEQRSFETGIVGGRRSGFRTWAAVDAPRPGRWRVSVHTESGQLVARRGFRVEAPAASTE